MKKSILSVFALLIGISVSAQKVSKTQSSNIDPYASLQKQRVVGETNSSTLPYRPDYKPVSKSLKSAPGVEEILIGGTVYDTQTNSAVANRIYAYPDGTIGTVWTMGFTAPGYTERGTGYNYYDGSNWGAEPTARIEPVRTGWPSYCPLGDGEVVVSHDGSTGLRISKRAVRGTGTWTTTSLPGTLGGGGMTWPRVISNGNTLHVIVCGAAAYQGLDVPLLYYRSVDGGATWEAPRILPGLDAVTLGAGAGKSFSGFGGDSYAWAAPKGDTIAFALAEGMGGAWIMKSYDDGVTWDKITIFTMPILTVAPSPIMASSDGSISIALDSHAKAHVVFGRMRVSDDDYVAANNSYYPYTDGLIYWNESMPQLDTTQLENTDTLEAHGNLLAWMIDYSGNDTIDFPDVPSGTPTKFPFGKYGVSMSSMGQIVIDKDDNMFVTYSSCREDLMNTGANPNVELYRHLYTVSKLGDSAWSEPRDLTDDLDHEYDECVFASLSYSTNDKLHILYHLDGEPGTAVGSDADPADNNYVNYLTFPTFVSVKPPVDIAKYVQVSPNPASDVAHVQVSLSSPQKVELRVYDLMGKLVMHNKYGVQPTGYHTYNVNIDSFTKGIYLFSVQLGSNQTSCKLVVQ
jgi:hypothetical protein